MRLRLRWKLGDLQQRRLAAAISTVFVSSACAESCACPDERHQQLATDALAPRSAGVGPGWREVFVSSSLAGATQTAAEAVERGLSVVLLDGLVTAAECETLRAEASREASQQTDNSTSRYEGLAEMPLSVTSPDEVRMPITEMLSLSGQALCDRLLLRSLERLALQLPALLPSLFGDAIGDVTLAGSGSVTHNPLLVFTPGEPACNVYGTGGEFRPHEDRQSITILIPLSVRDDYAGGGTGFWSAADRGPTGVSGARAIEVHGAPTFVLTPPMGTALVFGGDTTHAGQEVLAGERTVFVASFSPKKAAAASARPGEKAPSDWVLSLGGQPRWVRWLAAVADSIHEE